MEENSKLDLCAYYRGLQKGEKGKLLNYLQNTYGMCIATLYKKFGGWCEFSRLEEITIRRVIDSEPWKG